MDNNVFVILGPTCSGKTSLALDLCKRCNGEIISADSRQLCKYMDIGTGKFPIGENYSVEKDDKKWTINGVNIWGYDLVTPDVYFSAYSYAQFALERLRALRENKTVFLVGGTGFYINAVTGNTPLSGIEPDFQVRKSLENRSLSELLELATSLNLEVKNESERSNKQRIIRNLEKVLSEEKPLEALPYLNDTKYIFIGLMAERDYLYQRSDDWVLKIWENGLSYEVENLRKLGYGGSPKLKSLIYGQVGDYLDGKLSQEDCIQKMKFAMHAYIRRQETYFKKMADITWFDVSKDSCRQNVYNQVEDYVG